MILPFLFFRQHKTNQILYATIRLTSPKAHNLFMRVEDPEIQKATGETDPVNVMAKLREMKNNFK